MRRRVRLKVHRQTAAELAARPSRNRIAFLSWDSLKGTAVSLAVHLVVLGVLGSIILAFETDAPRVIISTISDEMGELEAAEIPAALIEPPPAQPLVSEAQLVQVSASNLVGLESSLSPTFEGIGPAVGNGASSGSGDGVAGEIAARVRRAGGKSGDVQISLAWENGNDLDLHVTTPTGITIFFGHRRSTCHGELDVDMNAGGPASMQPVENIYWPKRRSPFGTFKVGVHHFANHGSPDPTHFKVSVTVDGVNRVYSGVLRRGDPIKGICEITRKEGTTPKFKEGSRMRTFSRGADPLVITPAKGERAAQTALRRGKRYKNSRPQLAAYVFRNLISKYPDTEAAAEARRLLTELD